MLSIKKNILDNGLTILVCPVTVIPKVAIQLWYGVGSKDEKDGQRGLAHLLEHMIFKGTNTLSESDINMISHKLSGNCNAFTSYDYTGYIFDFPKQNWQVSLPLLADCMKNCTFKEDLLNAELKAVIQELKMYKDDYQTSLCENMISAIFSEHPYHYPIIGYKQDLWNINREALLSFYKTHYVPNNATLVIVGDVVAEDAIEEAKKAFSAIPADKNYKKEVYNLCPDVLKQKITMARDVQQPTVVYAWAVPGSKDNQAYIIDIASWIIGEGKGSRLYKKLIDELGLATDIQVDLYELSDQSVLFMHIDPIDQSVIEAIEKIVIEEIDKLRNGCVSEHELQRACKQAYMEHLGLFENNQKMAYEIGKLFLATQNENAIFSYVSDDISFLKKNVEDFFKKYIKGSHTHQGMILPLSGEEKNYWIRLQEESDKDDQRILSRKVRESTVECGRKVEDVTVNEVVQFKYPRAQKKMLKNGLTVIWHSTSQTPKIDIVLDLKVRHFYDPEEQQGLINYMSEMMLEGTKDYTDEQLADAAESRGISIDVRAGMISLSMLKDDLEFALSLLLQILTRATFNEKNIAKIRNQLEAEIAQFWDSPNEFAGQLIRSALYDDHPYHKNSLGNLKTLKKIKRADLIEAYQKYITPYGARMSIVGDLESIDIATVIEKALHSWTGPIVEDLDFPAIAKAKKSIINYQINRDQTVLCFAGPSVARMDKNFDALLLFDQVFSGGVLGSMSSYLFQLREQTGLFYSIGGSLVAYADEQPGLVFIRTSVSNDRLNEAENLIQDAIKDAKDKITEIDLEHARNALVNSLVDNFESNDAMAQTFLFIDRFGLPCDYFDNRMHTLKSISLDRIKATVGQVLDTKNLIKLKIGRVN